MKLEADCSHAMIQADIAAPLPWTKKVRRTPDALRNRSAAAEQVVVRVAVVLNR